MYEYQVFDVDDDEDSQEITSQLNDLAEEGWRLVSSVRTSELIFTKPKAKKSKEELLWKIRFFLEREKPEPELEIEFEDAFEEKESEEE